MNKRVDVYNLETLDGDTLTLYGITEEQTQQIIKNKEDIQKETERAESKESELNSLITSETSRAESKESELNSLITSETSRAESAESNLNSMIASETTRAQREESRIEDATAQEFSSVEKQLNRIDVDISTEVNRAKNKENELNSLITSETSRAESAESNLNSMIASETSRATEREDTLQSAITAEANRAEQAEAQIKTSGSYFLSVSDFITYQVPVNIASATSVFDCVFTKNITNNDKQLFGVLSVSFNTTSEIGDTSADADLPIGLFQPQVEIDGILYTLDFTQNDFSVPAVNWIQTSDILSKSYNYELRSYRNQLFIHYHHTKEKVSFTATIPLLIKLTSV